MDGLSKTDIHKLKEIRRKKRSTVETAKVSMTAKEEQKPLQRTNSASTLLGLTVLLYPDVQQYKLSVNNFQGFKVRSASLYICVSTFFQAQKIQNSGYGPLSILIS